MEQQEETTEQVHKKRRQISSSSKSTLSIPLDVVSGILSKLHVKYILRFRCVSKLWSSSITTDPYFIKRRPSLLLCFRRRDRLFVFSIPQDHQNSNGRLSVSSQAVDDSYHMKPPKLSSFSTSKSVQGLICCCRNVANPIIWNPTTRKFLTLTNPEKSWKRGVTVFLGYDPVECKHKVLCMASDNNTVDECWVLTLGSAQESWRRVKTNHTHHPIPRSNECINGVLYYKAHNDSTIMSFDVRSEKFSMIKVSWSKFGGIGKLTTYEGRLACVESNPSGFGVTLWILRDAEKHEWSHKHFPTCSFKREGRFFYFTGITDAGEFVYVPSGINKSFDVLYHDPERNRSHRVEFKGIANDEFRLKNGLGKRRLDNIHIVLNHKESFMSL